MIIFIFKINNKGIWDKDGDEKWFNVRFFLLIEKW